MSTILELLNSKYTVFVGSDAGNDVVFNDAGVSPRHCQISKEGDNNFLVADFGSATGTFVNNKKIDKEFISESDFIKVGENIFQLTKKILAPAAAAPTVGQTERKESVSTAAAAPPLVESRQMKEEKTTPSDKTKIRVYFLSAPEDENTCRSIDKHLSTIHFNTSIPIEITGDFKIGAGENIGQYKEQIFTADIVLVFVSVDLLNNDECYGRLKKVIANHNSRRTTLLPILARNCMWKATPFANLPLLPKNQHPLNDKQFWNSEDDALTSVVNDIYNAINDFSRTETTGATTQQTGSLGLGQKSILEIDWRKNYLWKVFWKRVAASLLDGLIIGIPLYLIFYMLVLNSALAQTDYNYDTGYGSPEGQILEIMFYYLLIAGAQILICAFMESSKWRGTPGKLIMKLQITDNAGNPISFGKAFIRNIIKWLITAFTGVGNGILPILYIIAQIVAYSYSKKFFHDQLSNTVIGERSS